jgi:hypothetical protein
MSRVPERKTPRSFADVAPRLVAPPASDMQEYDQLTFEGVETQTKEIEIDNLQITKQPTTRKTETGSVWGCTVAYQQDLWHQEDFGVFVLHASHHAETAQALKLKVNDLLLVRGVPWTQRITLRGGNVQTIHHINVTDIHIISRAPRGAGARRQH